MITEDYVSFEIAKLLKEKGFDIPCHYEYHANSHVLGLHRKAKNFNGKEYQNLRTKWYSAPSQSLVMKWLREVYKINIEIFVYSKDYDGNLTYSADILLNGNRMILDNPIIYTKHEQVCEAAIKFCLEKLI